jgi:uncharacterized protein (TIGR03083 family)
VDATEHIEHLAADGPLLAAAAERAGWDAAVPGTHWDVRRLVTHVGGVHRWAADIVETGSPTAATAAGEAVGSGPRDAELLEWFREGHAVLVETLSTAPADLKAFAFLPAPSPLAFWARRQAHETGIHRADAEAASAAVTPFDPDFAQDGIGEMLGGFAARKSNAIGQPAIVALRPTDGGAVWSVTFGGERLVAEPGVNVDEPDLTVEGSSSDIYLWLWNRPSAVEVSGDDELAALWRKTVRVRWG